MVDTHAASQDPPDLADLVKTGVSVDPEVVLRQQRARDLLFRLLSGMGNRGGMMGGRGGFGGPGGRDSSD